MSGGITAGTLLTAAAVGVGTMAVMKSMQPDVPKPKAATPQTPPQAAQVPEQRAMRSSQDVGAAGGPGAASTMLTGSSGIDASTLNLGKNTLLGG
jgi:hypothetical protein